MTSNFFDVGKYKLYNFIMAIERELINCFCENCRTNTDCFIESNHRVAVLKNKKYYFEGKRTQCLSCGKEVYNKEVVDFNCKALLDEYRKENNLISYEKILEIPRKYCIGNFSLSILLGWRTTTFAHYCKGYVPTKRYSNELKRIYDDPLYFEHILDTNYMRLKNESSYYRSKRAVNNIKMHTSKG